MNVQQFLEHHRLNRNPFSEEDAQTDPVFKEHCIESTYHPAWDKVCGSPSDPSTSIVFGPKGSGKTAMRLQLDRRVRLHNQGNREQRVFLVHYDDFNSFLGQFQQRLWWSSSNRPEKILQAWRLWDHIDAILCVGVTELVGRMLRMRDGSFRLEDQVSDQELRRLDRGQCRDLLLLTLLYDQSTVGSFDERFRSLRKSLRYRNWSVWFPVVGGIVWSVLSIFMAGYLWRNEAIVGSQLKWLPLILLIGWLPYLYRASWIGWTAWKIRGHLRVSRRSWGQLFRSLMQIPGKELAAQPLPTASRTDDRYGLLEKFQAALKTVGFPNLIVIVDRVDEPHLINGLPERMRLLVWPMLDNKLLKHPGLGVKMMLPYELHHFVERESRDFYERARLDKQNVVSNFSWTGESLYDLVAARLAGCTNVAPPALPEELFETSLSRTRILSAFQSLQVPRNLFRFLFRVVSDHCNKHTNSQPNYRIAPETFETTLALFQKELDRPS